MSSALLIKKKLNFSSFSVGHAEPLEPLEPLEPPPSVAPPVVETPPPPPPGRPAVLPVLAPAPPVVLPPIAVEAPVPLAPATTAVAPAVAPAVPPGAGSSFDVLEHPSPLATKRKEPKATGTRKARMTHMIVKDFCQPSEQMRAQCR